MVQHCFTNSKPNNLQDFQFDATVIAGLACGVATETGRCLILDLLAAHWE